jgi:hypothetical protein
MLNKRGRREITSSIKSDQNLSKGSQDMTQNKFLLSRLKNLENYGEIVFGINCVAVVSTAFIHNTFHSDKCLASLTLEMYVETHEIPTVKCLLFVQYLP